MSQRSDIYNGIPVGLLEEFDDEFIQKMTAAKTAPQSTMKEKERKVIEFKSRVLELVETYVQNTKHTGKLLDSVPSLLTILGDFSNHQKQQYLRRVCKLVQLVIKKGDLAEYLDNIEATCQQLARYIHKCKDNGLRQQFQETLLLIFKVLSSLHNASANKIIIRIAQQLIGQMKKNSCVSAQFVRKVINGHPIAIFAAFATLSEMCKITEHYDRARFEFANLLHFVCENKSFQAKIGSKAKLLEQFRNTIENVLGNIEQQKYKKVAIFRKIMLSYNLLKETLTDASIAQIIEEFHSEDQNLMHIVNKVKSSK